MQFTDDYLSNINLIIISALASESLNLVAGIWGNFFSVAEGGSRGKHLSGWKTEESTKTGTDPEIKRLDKRARVLCFCSVDIVIPEYVLNTHTETTTLEIITHS